jgi:ribosomal protein S27E
MLANVWDIPRSELTKVISSDRFNDVLQDDSRIRNLSKKELKEKIKGFMLEQNKDDEHQENDESLYKDYLLTVDCMGCGMFYSFTHHNEIPNEDFCCGTCGRTLIHYTGKDDELFEYEGNQPIIDEVVKEIQNEIMGDDEK